MAAQRLVTNALIGGLCVCLLLGHGAQAVFSMNDTCQLLPKGYIADPSDCGGFGLCNGNVLLGRGKCGDGLAYNARTGMCEDADKTECIVSKSSMCKGLNAVLKADPDSCNNYCYCNNGLVETASCPKDQFYNPDTQQCVWAVNYAQCAPNSPCRLVPNNVFIADTDPNNCGGFLNCLNGVGIPGQCDRPGYVFNPANGLCDTFTTMNCPNLPNGNGNKQDVDVATICKNSYVPPKNSGPGAVTNNEQIFSDGKTCSGYVVCKSPTQGSLQKCPFATHFNPTLTKCVTPYTFPCPYKNRCDNLNTNFVTAVNTQCKSYVSCQNQEVVGDAQPCSQSIDNEYIYFAENIGACVKDPPQQDICTQTVPIPSV